MTLVLSIVFFVVACVLAVFVLSDDLLQMLSATVRGTGLEPRQLLTVRKIGYVILVVYLFTWAFTWRRWVVDPAAYDLAVREQDRGDVHLTGSIVRLSLGGFRGLTTCYLWNLAMEKQKKNQLNELEIIVGWLTELQPHFNTPWLFQSWNLAYNVSNKTDRLSDKYFYISRGIRLLADGERQNHDDPDLRFELASTYQHKICQSDETNYHRSLFQLSLIPPNERNPARFMAKTGGRQKMDSKGRNEFIKFCVAHPQLIRRLREGIHKDSLFEQHRLFTCATPEAVVQFLADNYRVPSLYKEAKPTPQGAIWTENTSEKPDKDTLERFPVMPPPRNYADRPALHLFLPYDQMTEGDLTDESPYGQSVDAWDAYLVARSWYSYSLEPLPPPGEMPGQTEPVTDRVHQRMNRHMQTIIFRHYPARAQSYIAERLEEEGWYDDEGWSTKGPEWFNEVVGKHSWAVNAWEEAYKMWAAHGQRNHLVVSAAELAALEAKKALYVKAHPMAANGMQPATQDADDAMLQEGWKATQFLFNYNTSRSVANFPRNFARTDVERQPTTVRARKLFYEAEGLAAAGSTLLALDKYEKPDSNKVLEGRSALEAWASIMEKNAEALDDGLLQEQSYEYELNYLDVLNRTLPGNEIKAQLAGAGLAGGGMAGWVNLAALGELVQPRRFPAVAVVDGPFDRVNVSSGSPWIGPSVKRSVQERRRLYQPRRKDADEGPTPQPAVMTPPVVAPPP